MLSIGVPFLRQGQRRPTEFPGSKGWGKAKGKGGKGFEGKGYGKGKGKVSDMDEAGWTHVGTGTGGDWNWAAGSEWAAAEADPGWPSAATWPSQVEVATPPWMAAAQTAQPAWPPSWPGAAGAPAAPHGLRSMSPAGFVGSFAAAPVQLRNRFQAFEERHIIDSVGAVLDTHEEYKLQDFVKTPSKPKKSSKKRRGKRALYCSDISASTSSGNMFSRTPDSMSAKPFESPSSSTSSSTSSIPSSCLQTRRPCCCSDQGYQHPDHGQTLKPHFGSRLRSGICSIDCCTDHTYFSCYTHDPETLKIEETQLILDGFLRDSQEGVGGSDRFLGKPVGVGGSVENSVGVGGIPGKIPGGIIGEKE